MAIEFRKNANTLEPTIIKGQIIEQVQSYKYLGTIIDSKLKGHQHLFCLRKLCHGLETCLIK